MSSSAVLVSRVTVEHLTTIIKEVGKRCPRGVLPNSYLVVDLETSGFNYNPKNGSTPSRIVQIGYAAVRDREIVANDAFLLKRPPGTMFGEALEVTGITDEMLATAGREPTDVIPLVIGLFDLYRESKCMFMGHNFVSFDSHFIYHDFRRDGYEYDFDPNAILDTGVIFKAAQLGLRPSPLETLQKFQHRIRYDRSRVKWRIPVAVEMLGIAEKHDINLEDAHDAGFDCKVTHLIFEELRMRAGI